MQRSVYLGRHDVIYEQRFILGTAFVLVVTMLLYKMYLYFCLVKIGKKKHTPNEYKYILLYAVMAVVLFLSMI